jgi:hypothetical protein
MRSFALGDLDKFELLASYGKFTVALMGNPQTSDFELVDLDDAEKIAQVKTDDAFVSRGLRFIGAFAILDGLPRTAFTEFLDDATIDTLAWSYAQHYRSRLEDTGQVQRPPGDSLQHLEALWSLHDPRLKT